MRIEREIYNTIKWDSSYNENLFFIGYKNRGEETKKVPFAQFNPHGDIPWHRVKIIYYKNKIIWDRENKLDILNNINNDVLVENKKPNESIENFDKRSILNKSCGFLYNNSLSSWENNSEFKSYSNVYLESITLLSCNVLCDIYQKDKVYSDLRYPKLMEYLRNIADIIHLQEVTPTMLNIIMEEKWVRDNYYISDTVDTLWKPFGVVTLCRYPIINTYELYINPEKRPVVVSEIVINGEKIFSVNIHLSSNRRGGANYRKNEVENLKTSLLRIGAENILLAGDFNFNDDSESIELECFGFIDIDRFFYGDLTTNTYNPDINKLAKDLSPMGTPRRMDRIYINSNNSLLYPIYFEVIDKIEFVNMKFLSDHFILLSEFELNKKIKRRSYLSSNFKSKINFVIEGYEEIMLLESNFPMIIDNNLRKLVKEWIGFEVIPIKKGSDYIITTNPNPTFLYI